MTRRRFYAPPTAFTAPDGATVALGPEESRHLRDVLRLGIGDEAFVFDGEGREYRCVVFEQGRGAGATVTLQVTERVAPLRPESPLHLTLAVALLKSEKFDLVVQKATELGVSSIVPVVTKRADVRLRDRQEMERRRARWQRVVLEAAKQSGRARLPEINLPCAFASLIERADGDTKRLLFAERSGRGLVETTKEWPARPARLTALTGPEGGWEDEEITEAAESGWAVITLGGRTLRAETAAIIAAGLLQHLYGDLV